MSYSKKFFLVLVLVASLVAACFMILLNRHPIARAATIVVVTAVAAILGRFSDTLAEKFARFCGNTIALQPIFGLACFGLQRQLRLVRAIQTANGRKEITYDQFDYTAVKEGLQQMGIAVEPLRIPKDGFTQYLEVAKYDLYHPEYYRETPQYLVHKQIQHYVSLLLTPVQGHEVWMDVASSQSPFPEIVSRLYSIAVHRQDLSYPAGIQGFRIGSDATRMPVPDNFADRVSLHCSFEHFEQDSDVRFFEELARVLWPGGVACIIPLYVSNEYQILTNPRYWLSRGIPIEDGAQITLSQTYWESHGRFYNSSALKQRVITPLEAAGLKYTLYEVEVPPGINYSPFLALKVIKLGSTPQNIPSSLLSSRCRLPISAV